jgi:hypothetical protein
LTAAADSGTSTSTPVSVGSGSASPEGLGRVTLVLVMMVVLGGVMMVVLLAAAVVSGAAEETALDETSVAGAVAEAVGVVALEGAAGSSPSTWKGNEYWKTSTSDSSLIISP